MRSETIALHAGYVPDPSTKATAVPIYQTVAYAFDNADHGAALFNLEAESFRYGRISNPTTSVLEQRVAALEGGVGALCASSGQAALHYAILNLVEIGSNIVSVPQLYGTTHTLFSHMLRDYGVAVRFAQTDDRESVEHLIDDKTRAVFCESVGNPAGNICDVEALATAAHRHGIPLVVDNTVATPILLRPIEFGANIIVHSLTKFMGRTWHDARRSDWRWWKLPVGQAPEKVPAIQSTGTVISRSGLCEALRPHRLYRALQELSAENIGVVLSPLGAFLLLQGIETVALRVERHVANAKVVAHYLRGHPKVAWVSYTGFEDNQYYDLAQKYLRGQACSLITFGVLGGSEAGIKFYDAMKLVSRLVNLGDAKSLACHPASTTHRQMSAADQLAAGVRQEMIRLSVGIEHVDDIIADLDQALERA
jgi:O-acetylhomoserine (thiol)-lyase